MNIKNIISSFKVNMRQIKKSENDLIIEHIDKLQQEINFLKGDLSNSATKKLSHSKGLPLRIKIHLGILLVVILFFGAAWIIKTSKLDFCNMFFRVDAKGTHLSITSPIEYHSKVNYPFYKGDTVFVFLKFDKLSDLKEPIPFKSIVDKKSNTQNIFSYKLRVLETIHFDQSMIYPEDDTNIKSVYMIAKIVKL